MKAAVINAATFPAAADLSTHRPSIAVIAHVADARPDLDETNDQRVAPEE